MYLVRTKKRQIWKVMSLGLSAILIFSPIFPPDALAGRSDAGGGDLAEFDVGKWALGTAVGVASLGLGTAVSEGIMSAWSGTGFSAGFSSSIGWSSLSTWLDKYSVFAATTQVSNAFGRMGNYYGWDPGFTLFVSSMGSNIVGGGFSPGQFGAVSGITNGMALGAINGAVEGAILSSVADKKGQLPPWAGPVAGLAGNFVTSGIVGGLTPNASTFSFANFNSFDFSSALGTAGAGLLRSIPSTAIGLGVNYLTQDMGKQDAYIYKQAFSGLYPVADTTAYLGLLWLGVPEKYLKKAGKPGDAYKVQPTAR